MCHLQYISMNERQTESLCSFVFLWYHTFLVTSECLQQQQKEKLYVLDITVLMNLGLCYTPAVILLLSNKFCWLVLMLWLTFITIFKSSSLFFIKYDCVLYHIVHQHRKKFFFQKHFCEEDIFSEQLMLSWLVKSVKSIILVKSDWNEW